MAIDPVCGMTVDDSKGEFQTQFAGKKYFFCSEECKQEFENSPDEFAKPRRKQLESFSQKGSRVYFTREPFLCSQDSWPHATSDCGQQLPTGEPVPVLG